MSRLEEMLSSAIVELKTIADQLSRIVQHHDAKLFPISPLNLLSNDAWVDETVVLESSETVSTIQPTIALIASYGMNTTTGHICAFPVEVDHELYIAISITLTNEMFPGCGDVLRHSVHGVEISEDVHRNTLLFMPVNSTAPNRDQWLYVSAVTFVTLARQSPAPQNVQVVTPVSSNVKTTPSAYKKMFRIVWGKPLSFETLTASKTHVGKSVRAYIKYLTGVSYISHFNGTLIHPMPLYLRDTLYDAVLEGKSCNDVYLLHKQDVLKECPFLSLVFI